MQEIVVEKKRTLHYTPNDPEYVSERTQAYECSRCCRLCPFPGLKCCEVPDFERLGK